MSFIINIFKPLGILLIFQITMSNAQQKFSNKRIQKLKSETIDLVESKHKMTQIMIDKVFSFAELGHQEYETSKYLTSILNWLDLKSNMEFQVSQQLGWLDGIMEKVQKLLLVAM